MQKQTIIARDQALDILKGMLVLGMVLAHALQLLMPEAPPLIFFARYAFSLITFSGFMFAFGMGIAQSGPRPFSWPRLRRVLEILFAFYISAFAYCMLVSKEGLDAAINILSLSYLPPFSEFLAGFFVVAILALFMRPAILAVAATPARLALSIIFCLGMTFFPYQLISSPHLALFFGRQEKAYFSIIHYFPWLLLGIFYVQNKRQYPPLIWVLAALCTGAFALFSLLTHSVPRRFPPDLLWIVGSALPLLLYIWAAGKIGPKAPSHPALTLLVKVGEKSLYWLVASNLVLFSLYALQRMT